VQARSYYYHVKTTDYCGDVSQPGNLGKSILLKTTVNNDDNVQVDWSAYQRWEDGVKLYELELLDANGNFVKHTTNNFTDTGYVDASGNYNQMPQVCYRVKAVSNSDVISYSNIDCEKGRSSIFVPNAFTPNPDGHNSTFIIVGSFIKTYELNIFNRYGEKIYTSNSLDISWDGTYKGKPVQDDAYMYVIHALGMDGKHHNLTGTVTVLN
jgi:gliding motility-associated-like protein